MNKDMCPKSREEFLRTLRKRYHRASRAQKSRLLDEACETLQMHRKALIRNLAKPSRKAPGRRGRPCVYSDDVAKPIKVIWAKAQQPCASRLHAALPLWLPFYEQHVGELTPEVRAKLQTISASTIGRLLAPVLARRRRGLPGTRAVRHLKGQIPVRTRFQRVEGPGWIEADTVAHCGDSLAGAFVWTLTCTDIWSGWTENAAVWNRKALEITRRVAAIEKALPFAIVGFDTDNGSEFINHDLLKHLRHRDKPVEFTRSRPYHKNDNAHVEQKQFTHVRQLLGYDRLDNRRLVGMISDLYRNEWRLYQNFFQPCIRLIDKIRIGARWKRLYTPPETPCARLLASPLLGEDEKTALRDQRDRLDPFELHDAIEKKLRTILKAAKRKKPQRLQISPKEKPALGSFFI